MITETVIQNELNAARNLYESGNGNAANSMIERSARDIMVMAKDNSMYRTNGREIEATLLEADVLYQEINGHSGPWQKTR